MSGDVDREDYRQKKADLMSRKKTLEEKIGDLEQGRNSWLGPMREWLNEAQNIGKIARNSDLSAKKVSAKKIFGSDLHLSAKKITGRPLPAGRQAQINGRRSPPREIFLLKLT